MAQKTFRQLIRTPQPKIGSVVLEFDTPGIAHILKAAGVEFLFLDMEHTGFGFAGLKRTLRYLEAAQMPSMVRVPSDRYDHIARALDIGAEAVMVPMVGSAAQVRRILDSMKYAPQGQRGFAPQIAHDRYTPGSVMTKMREANRKTCFFAQIETAEGAENAKEIAAVRGVDCLWMGHFDLSCSLGIAGQYDHPRFKAAVQRVVDAAKQHGKALGRMVQDVETGAASYRQGFTVLAYHVDAWALYEFMKAGVSALRTRCAA